MLRQLLPLFYAGQDALFTRASFQVLVVNTTTSIPHHFLGLNLALKQSTFVHRTANHDAAHWQSLSLTWPDQSSMFSQFLILTGVTEESAENIYASPHYTCANNLSEANNVKLTGLSVVTRMTQPEL